MHDPEDTWRRDAPHIESPCVQLCSLHPEAKLCVGCYRSGDEISQWPRLTPAERQEIMADLPARAALIIKRRGGRQRHKDKS